jgi:hypothetical protein
VSKMCPIQSRNDDKTPNQLQPTWTHWSNVILIPRLKLALFLYNKKVEIYITEFKYGKNNKIQ